MKLWDIKTYMSILLIPKVFYLMKIQDKPEVKWEVTLIGAKNIKVEDFQSAVWTVHESLWLLIDDEKLLTHRFFFLPFLFPFLRFLFLFNRHIFPISLIISIGAFSPNSILIIVSFFRIPSSSYSLKAFQIALHPSL